MLWRHVQCPGNPGLEQRATTWLLQALCHLRGTRATLSPEGRKPVKPHSTWELSSTHCPLPGGRQLESSSTLSLSRAGMAASCPPCHTPMAPTCSELSQAPLHSPHVSSHSLHHQTRAAHKARPPPGRTGPACLIHPPLQTVYSRLSFAHLSQVSHVKNPCGVSDL